MRRITIGRGVFAGLLALVLSIVLLLASRPQTETSAPAEASEAAEPPAVNIAAATNAAEPVLDGVPISPDDEYVPGQTLVRFKPEATASEREALFRGINAKIVRRVSRDGNTVLVRLPKQLPVPTATAALSASPIVEIAEENIIYYKNEIPDDPDFSNYWGLNNTGQTGGTPDVDIDAPEAWDQDTGNTAVILAVIDTGIDYDHPDLVGNVWINPGEIPGNDVDDDGNGYADDIYGIDTFNGDSDPWDDEGHGTHVAGTIAATGNNGIGGAGVMWGARVIGCKFLGAEGYGSSAGAIECLEYLLGLKENGVEVVLSNNSWGGGGYSELLSTTIAAHGAEDILFVAAAGNSGLNTDMHPHYPSSYEQDNIISVAAIDASGNLAGFSNYGATSVDIAAPGVSILSTIPGAGWGYASGTSMASPHVAGVAGLQRSNDPGLSMAEIRNLILVTGTPDERYDGRMVTGARLRIDLPIVDADGDGMPDRWEELYGLDPNDPSDAALDVDADGLTNLEEYEAGSNPTVTDTDGDGLSDAEEVNDTGTSPVLEDTDGEGLSDGDEILVYGTDPLAVDTDNDGLDDAEEVNTYGTDPTSTDTDGDGLPDGWEVEFGFDPVSAGDEAADADGDGLSNGGEYDADTNPLLSDTDGDGLDDAEELDVYGTDPLNRDTDSDGMDDGWEIANGFDATDPADAALDADDDGYPNLIEYRRGTDPNNPNSFPILEPWNSFQGNTRRTGFAPLTTDAADFSERWSVTAPGYYPYLSNPVSGDFRLFFPSNDNTTSIGALSMANGELLWLSEQSGSYVDSPVLDDSGVVAPSFSYGLDNELIALDPTTGTDVNSIQTNEPVYFTQLMPRDGVVYLFEGDRVVAREIVTGDEVWSTVIAAPGYSDLPSLAVNDDYVALLGVDKLQVLARADGELLREIPTGSCTSYSRLALLIDGDKAYSIVNGCVSRIDLGTGAADWQVDVDDRGEATPALDDTAIYVGGYNGFAALDKNTGNLSWSSTEVTPVHDNNVVVTLDHVFVSDYWRTVAFDLDTREIVWTVENNTAGRLLVTDDGALVIASVFDSTITAISLEGDSDGDGIPNWWERFYRLDFADPSDATNDADSDGLDNLTEYELGTSPEDSDSDRDGLDDGYEVNTSGTDPANSDSDEDGLGDGDEINVWGTDPLNVDTDGDEVSDGDEVKVYGTDPNDPGSAPDLLRSYFESFESGIPADWVTPEGANAGWAIDNAFASDGSFSLEAQYVDYGVTAVVEWSDLFASGELAFDARLIDLNCCASFRVLFDGEEVQWIYANEWQRSVIDVPAGEHTIRFEYTRWNSMPSETDGAWVDAVEFYVPDPVASGLDNVVATSWATLAEITREGEPALRPIELPGVGYTYGTTIAENHQVYLAEAPRLHRYDPVSEELTTTEYAAWQTWYGTGIAAIGDRLYATNSETNYGIIAFDLDGNFEAAGLKSTIYIDLYAGPDGYLYALQSNGVTVDRVAVPDMNIVSSVNLGYYSNSIAVSAAGEIYAGRNTGQLDRYDANGSLMASAAGQYQYGLGDISIADNGSIYAADWAGSLAVFSEAPELLDYFDTSEIGLYASSVEAVRRQGADADGDGIADWWEKLNDMDASDASDASLDPDGDSLSNAEEYALGTDPNDPDSDQDGLSDGDERDVYGTDPKLSDTDYDGLSDNTEVNETGTDPANSDSDSDGLEDGLEVNVLGTNPLSTDSDGDGMPDGWEYDNGLDAVDAGDAALDPDGDGLSNLREYENGTRINVADSDRDGLNDGDELDAYGTDPLSRDSDGDGMPDGWEIDFGFDPLSNSNALEDNDADGYNNLFEYYAGSDPTSDDSVPMDRPWTTYQGGPDHRGFVPTRLYPVGFEELWTVQPFTDPALHGLRQVAATETTAWISTESYFGYQALAAIDAATGAINWSYEFAFDEVYQLSAPAIADNRVYVQTSGHEASFIWGFGADTGELAMQTPYLSQWPWLKAPTPFEGDLFGYSGYYGGVASFSGSEATVNWQLDLDFYDRWSPAVDDTSVYVYTGIGLSVIDRFSGMLADQLYDPGYVWNGYAANSSPIRDYAGNIIVSQGTRLVSFDVTSGTVAWEYDSAYYLTQPVLVGDAVLVAGETELVSLDTGSGAELWRASLPDYVAFPMLATVNHLLVSSWWTTYAINLTTHEVEWSYPRGGQLSISPGGLLFIAGSDLQLSAIQLSVDLDDDGMSDAWEETWGFDPTDPSDGSADSDSDTLSNLEEFIAGANPMDPDSDGDGLMDGDEVKVHGTSPLVEDTEGDGMPDGWEVDYGLLPLVNDANADADGDGATNIEELRANTDPSDAGSVPALPPRPPTPTPPPPGGGGGGALSPSGLGVILGLVLLLRGRRRRPREWATLVG